MIHDLHSKVIYSQRYIEIDRNQDRETERE